MTVLNLSFSGAGFLWMYHMGVAEAFLRHGDKLLGLVRAYAGASSGALVAALMVTAPDKIQEAKVRSYTLTDSVRQRQFGVVVPGHDLMLRLREVIEETLPNEAHHLASNRLHISITDLKSGKNHIISRFTSREELVKVLLASSFLPVYGGLKPVEFHGKKWVDGCFSNCLPILPEGRTITIAPFAGAHDVCPVHKGPSNIQLRISNMSIMFSLENMKYMKQSLFPASPSALQSLNEGGFTDAVRFLKREAWMS